MTVKCQRCTSSGGMKLCVKMKLCVTLCHQLVVVESVCLFLIILVESEHFRVGAVAIVNILLSEYCVKEADFCLDLQFGDFEFCICH